MSTTRTVYLKRKPDGYLGLRRYNFKKGCTEHNFAPFSHARIFLRKQDAEQYIGELVEATVTLKEVAPF